MGHRMVNEGGTTGYLPNRIAELGRGLATLAGQARSAME